MDYYKFITSILKQAEKIATDNLGKVEGKTKSLDNNQVLTITDLEIGNFLISKVKQIYPHHNVIDEEAGIINNNSDYTWVIDPIDGTSNFANNVPTYGIMIGLLDKNIPIAGGISLPSFKEIYVATKNNGTFLNDKKIEASCEQKLLNSLVAYDIDGHQEDPDLTKEEVALLGKIILKIRNLRSSNSAFDITMVAKGSYGGVLNKTSKIWDNVAPQIILEEAGCVYTNFYGKEMDYSDPLTKSKNNFTFCAAPKILHSQLQAIINPKR